jgi:hypothetical protein
MQRVVKIRPICTVSTRRQAPAGTEVATSRARAVRGQPPLEETIAGLRVGLLSTTSHLSAVDIQFSVACLALTILLTVPAVLCGVLIMLFITRTTVNVQSFMSDHGDRRSSGERNPIRDVLNSAERAARRLTRLRSKGAEARAILMTAAAMIFGMIPMALGLTESGKQTASGQSGHRWTRCASISTLFILPSIYAIFERRAQVKPPSLNPYDPESKYYEKA